MLTFPVPDTKRPTSHCTVHPMNLYHALDSYITYLTAERGASPHTVDAYNRDIIGFIKFLEEKGLSLSERPERSCIEIYIGHMREPGKKTRSIVRTISALLGLFNLLLADGVINHNPLEDIEIPKYSPPIPEVLSEQEVIELLNLPNGSKTSLRDRMILELLYATGLRVSELIKLKKAILTLKEVLSLPQGKGQRKSCSTQYLL